MRLKRHIPSRLRKKKKARGGFHGYPVATVAFYGPDDTRASKVAVSIIAKEGAHADPLERWFSEDVDLRKDPATKARIMAFIALHGAKSIAMMDRILGCPHEEGIDYPVGEKCPQCPFWATRDRFTGEIIE